MGNTKKLPLVSMSAEVIKAINDELAYQSTLEGSGRADALDHGVAGQIVTLNVYVQEANVAWTKHKGDELALDALRKVAAIAIRALEQYGCPSRIIFPKIELGAAPLPKTRCFDSIGSNNYDSFSIAGDCADNTTKNS